MATTTSLAKRGRGRPPKINTEAAHERAIPPIPAELTHFDELPDCAHVRQPVVMALYATKSPSTIWRNVKKGLIPAPVKLTPQISAWRVGDLRAALSRSAS
jgi:prophage regulatory protein